MELLFLEHELDRVLEQQQVGRVGAVQLDAGLVVPLDPAGELGAVGEHHDHRGVVLHLLEIVKALSVGLLSRYLFSTTRGATARVLVHHLGHGWTNQLSVRHVVAPCTPCWAAGEARMHDAGFVVQG